MYTTKKSNQNTDPHLSIGPYEIHAYLEKVKEFHGNLAPGMIMGGFMVDLALRHLPENILYDALCETQGCLPDAIQVLTPCTIGNGWLFIEDYGRYALTLYDKYQGTGIRVWVDMGKMKLYREVYNWFMKITPKKEQDSKRLFAQIIQAGSGLLSWAPALVNLENRKKQSLGVTGICPVCQEAYPISHGPFCRACQIKQN